MAYMYLAFGVWVAFKVANGFSFFTAVSYNCIPHSEEKRT
jgi:hypothetical protein